MSLSRLWAIIKQDIFSPEFAQLERKSVPQRQTFYNNKNPSKIIKLKLFKNFPTQLVMMLKLKQI